VSLAAPIPAVEARTAAEHARDALSRDPRVQLVYLFGSAADPGRTEVRDIDLAILTAPALDLAELLRLRADLVDAMGAPIDLVSLNDAPIVLAHEVVDAGRCLFARSPELETDFVVRARARYLDWAPFREEQWRQSGERSNGRHRGA
jgi:predicted nucleotidyltransferase